MSLYGYRRPTTPSLDAWAVEARVFENCVSAASTTVASHASMFTGLLPTQHQADNQYKYLLDAHETVAEILRAHGYATFAFCENPFISAEHMFVQGFDRAEQPSDPKYLREATRLTLARILGAAAPNAPGVDKNGAAWRWSLKAPELVLRGAKEWLESQDEDRPFYLFLNYMEAHYPVLPSRKHRRRMLTPRQLRSSYGGIPDWTAGYLYTFGLLQFPERRIQLMQAMYDAALLELDEHFKLLLDYLRSSGRLENTVVVLTADHGEHIGDHHMLDHQYSVYDGLLRIPLVLYYPPRVAPGRDDRPVTNLDLFPTLLGLAGAALPEGLPTYAVNLLNPSEKRIRLSEYRAPFEMALANVKRLRPDFEPAPWNRSLRAYYDGRHKFIWGSDGRHELYDLSTDPQESRNLLEHQPALAARMQADLLAYVSTLKAVHERQPVPELSIEQRRRLNSLGYVESPSNEKVSATQEAKHTP